MRRLTKRFGEQRVLRACARLPRLNRKVLGLTILDPAQCVVSADRRHALFQPQQWPQWTVYRALTDLQRFSWHGLEVDVDMTYRSPMIEDRYR